MTATNALSRVALLACLALGAPQVTFAAPISLDNDVDIDWSLNGADCTPEPPLIPPADCPADSLVQIFGAPRLVLNASDFGDLVFFEVTELSADLTDFSIGLNVLFDNGSEVPLQLEPKVASKDAFGNWPDLFAFTLGDFANFNDLPTGVPLIFEVFAALKGTGFPENPLAVVTVLGEGTQVSEVEGVPEPGTLLLLGSGIAALVRRQTIRRGRS